MKATGDWGGGGWHLPLYLIHSPRLREDGEVCDFEISVGGRVRQA